MAAVSKVPIVRSASQCAGAKGLLGRARLLAAIGVVSFAWAATAECAEGAAGATDAARPLVEQAEEMLSRGRFAGACELLTQAVAVCPSWLRPRGLLGVALQGLGDDDGARAHYAAFQRGTLSGPSEAVGKVATLSAELLWLINDARRHAGLALLKPHAGVALVALRHSEEMRDLGYFSHDSPTAGQVTPLDRFVRVFGFRPALIAENIAMRKSTGCALTVENIRASHQDLMNSPGHRANILRAGITDLGVGLAAAGDSAYWITEVFVRFSW